MALVQLDECVLTSTPAGGDCGLDEGMSAAGLGGPGWAQVLVLVLVPIQDEAGELEGSPSGSKLHPLVAWLSFKSSLRCSVSRFLLWFLHTCSSCSELLLRVSGVLLSCNAPPSSSMDHPLWETLPTGVCPSAGWGEVVPEIFVSTLTVGPDEKIHQ